MDIEVVIGGLILLAVIAYRVYGRSSKSSNKHSTGKETPSEAKDIFAEVNVFLAYENFNLAEEFVKDAIAGDPDNLEFHSKLLEVYYAAGNKRGYEEAAKALHDKVDGQGPHWDMALAMWQEFSPNRALFEADE